MMMHFAVLRKKLSQRLDACVLDRPCRESDCEHSNKSGVWWVAAVNIGFTLLNIFHLAYLGLMFGGSEDEEVGLEQQVHIYLHIGSGSGGVRGHKSQTVGTFPHPP